MLDIAMHGGDGFVTLKDAAERQDISKKYLEQIVPLLTRAGMLKTNRGYQGGYMLAKPADSYTVGDILRAAEGDLCPVSCLQYEVNDCPRADVCMTLYVWQGLYKTVTDYLDGITLTDIIEHGNRGKV